MNSNGSIAYIFVHKCILKNFALLCFVEWNEKSMIFNSYIILLVACLEEYNSDILVSKWW